MCDKLWKGERLSQERKIFELDLVNVFIVSVFAFPMVIRTRIFVCLFVCFFSPAISLTDSRDLIMVLSDENLQVQRAVKCTAHGLISLS